jgi:hypothetical protein
MKRSNTYGLLIAAIVMVTGSVMAAPPVDSPDAASTSMLLAGSLMGLAAVKRWIAR